MGTANTKNAGGNTKPNIQSFSDPCSADNQGKNINLAGVEARVDKVSIEGLQRTKDDIIIETVQDLFAAQDFQGVIENAHRVRSKLENLGCFQNIGIFIDTSSGKEATLNGLEVTFFVKELKRMIGGVTTMVGNNEGSLVVGMRAPNLLGRGEKVQAEYSYGSRRTNNLSLSFFKPLRTKYDALFTASIFQQGSDWPWSGYKILERGVLLDLGFNSTCYWRHNIQYEGVWRELGTPRLKSAIYVREEAGHKIKSSLRHILTYDRRDALIFPTKGCLFRFTTEYAGVGGDATFLKNEFFWQCNIPLVSGIVLQGTLQGGHLKPYGDDGVTIHDKLYIGGPLSVRGYHTRGIGPQSNGSSLGSNVIWGAGLHLYTPLPFRPGKGGFGDLFRVHFFGNLGQSKDVDFERNGIMEGVKDALDGYRGSLGVGLALRLGQMARVEFNYVIPTMIGDADVPQEGFQFGVGIQFL